MTCFFIALSKPIPLYKSESAFWMRRMFYPPFDRDIHITVR